MAETQIASKTVICDGCGQGTTSEHIAARLARLEQTTRYRPIHIQAVFLCAKSPTREEEFLYAEKGEFQGEAAALLDALQIDRSKKDRVAVLTEFQRKGCFLTHVLECAPESSDLAAELATALRTKLPSVMRRLRTSLKPKKVFVISPELAEVVAEIKSAQAGAEVILDGKSPFDLADVLSVSRLRLLL